MGDVAGERLLDGLRFQSGALEALASQFSSGLAATNTVKDVEIDLFSDVDCKLKGC